MRRRHFRRGVALASLVLGLAARTQGLAAAAPTHVSVRPRAAWSAEGDEVQANFGWSVGTAGDVNGDGYADIIVGAYLSDHGEMNEGRAFVYYGSPSGPAATPDWTAEGDQVAAYFGFSVGAAGDVNGDGYDDVIVGAYQYDNGESNEGRAYVYYGSPSGPSATPDWMAEGDQASAFFGISVATAGDVNGDGYDDVLVGVSSYDHGEEGEGAAVVYHGSAAGLSATPDWKVDSDKASAAFGASVDTAGDVNGDGYDDVIVGAPSYEHGESGEGGAFVYYGSASGLSSTPAWKADSDQFAAFFGISVGTAGDVNGDGYADVIVGANYYDNGEIDEGAAFAYYGSASGLSATPDWSADCDQPGALFGLAVDTAGDVNGDGYADVVVGAWLHDGGQMNEGRAYAFYGSASGLSASADWKAESDQEGAWFGYSVGGAGDVNGDGLDDIIVGAPSWDHGQKKEGAAFLFKGRVNAVAQR